MVQVTVMGDLISRQDAIDECDRQYPNLDRQDFKAVINAVSSADRPTGEWKKIDTWKYCSECGWTIYTEDDRAYNYCPHCGAKMGCDESE